MTPPKNDMAQREGRLHSERAEAEATRKMTYGGLEKGAIIAALAGTSRDDLLANACSNDPVGYSRAISLRRIADSLDGIFAAQERAHPKPVKVGDWYEWPDDERTQSGEFTPEQVGPGDMLMIKTPLGVGGPVLFEHVNWQRSGSPGDVLSFAKVIKEN